MSALQPPPVDLPPMIPIPPNIAQIAFPLILGNLFNWLLYGVLSAQVYVYHLTFAEDRRIIKCLVYGVFLLETIQTALTGVDMYYWFASGFGNMLHLGNPYISPFDTPMMGALIALIVQGFFCYRIWLFNKSGWWLSALIGSISIVQCVAGIVGGVDGHLHGILTVTPHDRLFTYLWLVSDAVADIMIAAAMVHLLLKHRTQEHRFTNDVLMRSVRLVVETNTLTAGLALLAVILHAAQPNQDTFTAPTLAIGKVYSNTLLVAFNNRRYLRELKSRNGMPLPSKVNFRSQGTHLTSGTDSYSIRTANDIETANDMRLDRVHVEVKTTQL